MKAPHLDSLTHFLRIIGESRCIVAIHFCLRIYPGLSSFANTSETSGIDPYLATFWMFNLPLLRLFWFLFWYNGGRCTSACTCVYHTGQFVTFCRTCVHNSVIGGTFSKKVENIKAISCMNLFTCHLRPVAGHCCWSLRLYATEIITVLSKWIIRSVDSATGLSDRINNGTSPHILRLVIPF